MDTQAVIFDLDGVLVHTDRFHYLAWKRISDEKGIYFDETINRRLRGVSRMESLEIILERYSGPALSDKEKDVLEEVTRIMLDIEQIGCTACKNCCDGCPMKISIPDVFRAINTMTLYDEDFRPRAYYNGIVNTGRGKASDCIACGQCESVCPQHLPIIELLKKAAEKLDNQ